MRTNIFAKLVVVMVSAFFAIAVLDGGRRVNVSAMERAGQATKPVEFGCLVAATMETCKPLDYEPMPRDLRAFNLVSGLQAKPADPKNTELVICAGDGAGINFFSLEISEECLKCVKAVKCPEGWSVVVGKDALEPASLPGTEGPRRCGIEWRTQDWKKVRAIKWVGLVVDIDALLEVRSKEEANEVDCNYDPDLPLSHGVKTAEGGAAITTFGFLRLKLDK